jgi:hypothetical protein
LENFIGMEKTKIVAMSFSMMFTKVWSLNISFSNKDRAMQLTNIQIFKIEFKAFSLTNHAFKLLFLKENWTVVF